MARKRVAVLISGRGSNLAALIAATREREFPAEIMLVASNRADAAGLAHARNAGIATAIVDHAGKERETFEHALQQMLDTNGVELICLAGFMRLLTPSFVNHWQGRMINVHPALLPAFKGLNTHARALAAGVKIHGASVHFVVAEMDSGPIIAQGAVPVFDNDSAETLAARVLDVEHKIYPLALKLVAADLVEIVDGRCQVRGSMPTEARLLAPVIRQ